MSTDARDDDWGFPSFAKDFPRDDELDELVAAFVAGDYRTVNARAPKLAASATDDAVKKAALVLAERTKPDPTSRIVLALTAALLLFVSAWWITHDGPAKDAAPTHAPPTPTVEFVR